MKRLEKAPVRIFVSAVVVLVVGLFFNGVTYAQDPGIPDTVRFKPWGTYIPCPPCTGHAVVPLVVYTDEYLLGMRIILRSSGPVSWDTAQFVGQRANHMSGKGITILNDMLKLVGVSVGDTIPPGNGIIAYLHLAVQDTGWASVDTIIISEGPLDYTFFTDIYGLEVLPEVILKSEFNLQPQDSPPGDVDKSGGVDIVDAVFLINYLFRNGPAPPYRPCADPNIDCSVSLSDVVYLINYIFRSGPEPQPGCAY